MKTFYQCIKQIAEKYNWYHATLVRIAGDRQIEEAAQLYASECVKEALKLNGDRFNSGLSEQEILSKLNL